MSILTPIRNRIRTMFFGWWIVLAALAMQLLHAGMLLQAYGTYMVVWKQELGWSNTVLAGAYAGTQICIGLISPWVGWLLKRCGTRRVIATGVMLFAAGFFGLSASASLAAFFASLSLIAVGIALSGTLPLTTVVVDWFDRRRATAVALMQTGIGLGGLFVPLIATMIVGYGWRATAAGSGIVAVALALPLARAFRSRPEAFGLVPDGGSPLGTPSIVASRRGTFTARQALRTRAFWLLSLGHATGVTVISAILVHAVVYLENQLAYDLQHAAVIVAVLTGLTVVGQLIGGVVGDRADKRIVAALAMIGHAVGLVMLIGGAVLPFAIMQGLALGIRGPQMMSLRADYFGRAAFPTVMGISGLFIMAGQVGGPVLVGVLVDATQSYAPAFWLLAGLALLGSVLFLLATPPTSQA